MTNFLRETTQPIIFVSFKHNFESFQGVPKVVLEKIKNYIPPYLENICSNKVYTYIGETNESAASNSAEQHVRKVARS